jgi:hypothetical protein
MLLEPVESTEITPAGLFGMALNGVPFDPGTAEFWNRDPSSGWRTTRRSPASWTSART